MPLPDNPTLSIVVPTRDGSPYAFVLADAYRACGIDVLHVIDGRSSWRYRMEAAFRFRHRKTLSARQSKPFIEALLPSLAEGISSEWAFRYDDDEFPSAPLRDWLPGAAAETSAPVIAVPRRAIAMIDGQPMVAGTVPGLLPRDDQFRGFRPGSASFDGVLHSPGLIFHGDSVLHAPEACCMFHFDWIVRSRDERAAKLERYEALKPGSLSEFEHQYLFEDFDRSLYAFEPVQDPFIADLAHRLDRARRRSSRFARGLQGATGR